MSIGTRKSAPRLPRHLPRIRQTAPPGSPPGTLIADPAAARSRVRVMRYGPETMEEIGLASAADLPGLIGSAPVTWVNVDGLADVELIRALGELFGLHRLALEDVVNVHQRPKVVEYEKQTFVVARMIHSGRGLVSEQVSLFLGEGFLLTFQEMEGDCFDLVRERLRQGLGLIRERGADYLAYALLDALIDGYFPVVEDYGERLEALEDAVMTRPERAQVVAIHDMKRDLLTLRRAIWPQREMFNALARDASPHVSASTQVYLRDCYDHLVQLMDFVETYREIASGLVDVYLSSSSARMNEIMKVLTVIATIFMPLGFIASLYGMNFDPQVSPWNMPELSWYLGYPFALLLMATVAGGLILFFRRKGWVGG